MPNSFVELYKINNKDIRCCYSLLSLPFDVNFKGTLMQIWKSANIFVLYENNILKISH